MRLLLAALLVAGTCCAAAPSSASEFFVPTKIWTARIIVQPDQWNAMQPVRGDHRRPGPEKAAKNGYLANDGIEFHFAHADFEIEGQMFKDVGIRYKGNGTFAEAWEGPFGGNSRVASGREKVPYKIHFNEYVKGQKFGGSITTLNFQNNITDPGSLNETIAFRMYREAGVPVSRTTWARVYLTIPGKLDNRLLGLYGISEDIDHAFLTDHFGTSKGALLKPYDKTFLFNDHGADWTDYVQTLDPKDPPSAEEKKRIMDFCALMGKGSDAEFSRRLGEFIDLDEFSRFMAVTVWLSDGDNIMDNGHNFYVYIDPKTQKFTFMPWDLDHTFGQFHQRLNQKQVETRSILTPWARPNPFLERIFKVEAFRTLYLARLAEFSRTIFDPARLAAQVDELAPQIRPAVVDEDRVSGAGQLRRFDQAVAGTRIGDGVPIKPFAISRAQSVKGQLAQLHVTQELPR